MPLYMVQDDITRISVDAIVNPTDCWFSGSGGTDYAIHDAAGPGLYEELLSFPMLEMGQAVITSGYDLPAKYIIHTFGPIWEGGNNHEAELLADCYRNSLELAKQKGCHSVAFPVISGGTFGFPNDDALVIAKNTISEFLKGNDLDIYIVAYKLHVFNLGAKLFGDVSKYVSEYYVELDTKKADKVRESLDLSAMLKAYSETFSCMLDRMRHERGLSASELYNKARVHKSVYSKIMSNIHYKPAKVTAVAFSLALNLSWEDLVDLVGSAGFSMTHTNKFDVVIEYFVKNENYNIDEINETLFELDPDLPLIGC